MRHPEHKRQPHLLDVVERLRHPDKDHDRVVALRPIAKRFVFDRDASIHLGHFIRDCGDLIIANRQFAIPPFPTMYLQLELDDMLKALGRGTSADHMFGPPDTQVGYMLDGRRVYPVTKYVGAFRYEVDTPSGVGAIFHEPVQVGDLDDEWARLLLMLGTTLDHIPDEDTRLDIARSVRIKVDPHWDHISRMQRRDLILASAGDLRNVWAALLMLNQKRGNVAFHDVPWEAVLYKGKRRVFGAHSVVTIHLAPRQTIAQAMRPALHVPKAAHDVKGHFAHFSLKDGCEHVWPGMPDMDGPLDAKGRPVARWRCARCNGIRVWRKDYTTGSATVGFTTKEYEVKK